jgi:hypothetical protein
LPAGTRGAQAALSSPFGRKALSSGRNQKYENLVPQNRNLCYTFVVGESDARA